MGSTSGAAAGPPPRVAFLAGNLYPLLASREDLPVVGGAEVQQLLLARELRLLGFELHFVTEDLGQGAEAVADGFPVHAYRFGRNKLRQTTTLWRALRAANPEVLYLRGVPRFLAVVLTYVQRHRCALVLGLSTNRQVYARGPAGRGRGEDWIYRRALREAGAVVVQTRFQSEQLRDIFGRTTTHLIRNGAVLTPAASFDSPRDGVAWIGSLHPYKGIERFLELARRLPQCRFEVVGGPARTHEAYYHGAEARARSLPNLRWHGFVPHERVDEVLRRAIALVNTTVPVRGVPNLEGFPNVYLEAWRNAVPTLTLDNDPDDLIATHRLGRRCRDLEELALEVERLTQDPAARAACGRAAQEHLAQEHDIRSAARQYAELFRVVARGRRS